MSWNIGEIGEDIEFITPQTPQEMRLLIKELCNRYHFKNKDHVASIVASRLTHFPVDQSTTTLGYLASCVRRSQTYHIANAEGSLVQLKYKLIDLKAKLAANPNDMEARDEIQKFASKGSKLAHRILKQLDTVEESSAPGDSYSEQMG